MKEGGLSRIHGAHVLLRAEIWKEINTFINQEVPNNVDT
jgi:hypothetical protein